MAPQSDPAAAARLTAAGVAGVAKYPHDCSHSVWEMMRLLGVNEPYRTANDLMDHMAASGSGWRRVATLEEAAQLASAGQIVIGGLAKARGSGHVVMVMPGAPRPAGGFRMPGGQMMPSSRTLYPPSASGASSSWPGARSSGEKTVRDPWGKADWPSVTFWTRN